MKEEKNSASWTKNDSGSFVASGNVFVPDRARQYQRIFSLLPKASSAVNVLDICCVDTLH